MANGVMSDYLERFTRPATVQPTLPTAPPPIPSGYGMYGPPSQYTYNAPAPQPYYVDANRQGKKAAQETRAELARAEFEDYKRRYLPIEMQAINEMTTDFNTVTGQELDRTKYAIGNSYEAAKGMHSRRLGRYGLSVNPETDMKRSEVSSTVGGLNYATRNAEDRRMAFIGGGMSSLAEKKNQEG